MKLVMWQAINLDSSHSQASTSATNASGEHRSRTHFARILQKLWLPCAYKVNANKMITKLKDAGTHKSAKNAHLGKPGDQWQVGVKWHRENPLSLALLVQWGITAGKTHCSLSMQQQQYCGLSEHWQRHCDLDFWPKINGFPGLNENILKNDFGIIAP